VVLEEHVTAGDEVKQLVSRSGGPTPDRTLVVTVVGQINWERLASEIDALLGRYDPTEVTAVEIWGDDVRRGFVSRDAFEQKVRPRFIDQDGAMGMVGTEDYGQLAHEISGIPLLHRLCGYKDARRKKCGQPEDFPEPPNPMPQCRNPDLPPHKFYW
jgi:hypothetical protein